KCFFFLNFPIKKKFIFKPLPSDSTGMAYVNNNAPEVHAKKDKFGHTYYVDNPDVEIEGLYYFPDHITSEEEESLLKSIDSTPWSTALSRRQQFYGPVYFQTRHNVPSIQPHPDDMCKSEKESEEVNGTTSNYSEDINKMKWLSDRIIKDGFFSKEHPPTQVLVNEYVENQRIKGHVDNPKMFGDVIVGLSIGDPIYMTLTNDKKTTCHVQDVHCKTKFICVRKGGQV
ncbi:hypothetical protein RFI_29779, partial [Reticulomyxa filosa]